MLKRISVVICTILAGLVAVPAAASAAPKCHANDWSGIVLCISVTSNGSVQKGRVFQDGEDVYGIVSFGISQTDEQCAKDSRGNRPIRKNCSDSRGNPGGDFITPFSSFRNPRTAFCGVETMGSDGCGGRALSEGLKYVVGFDSGQGAFGVHKAPGGNIAESHGCVRASTTVSKFIYTAYADGETVRLVILDNR